MTKSTGAILQDGKSYTFSDYSEMDHLTKDIVAALGPRIDILIIAQNGITEVLYLPNTICA